MKPLFSLLLLGFATSGASFATNACSYDGQFNNPFTESFPGSLDIAIATQEALEHNHLQRIEALEGKQGLKRASWWLTLMAKDQKVDLESVTYIYLVDSHLWTKVTNGNRVEVHATPSSATPSSVMLLSEAALQALVQDKVDLQTAVDLGVVQFSS
ncbi:hypothetical protein L4D20_00700 [Vibrio kyushuensis]|uniref:hypothetical protein n=1 Tax=Vibrio kyushuensis TaxID=2910249 RepID=UPI003D0C347B